VVCSNKVNKLNPILKNGAGVTGHLSNAISKRTQEILTNQGDCLSSHYFDLFRQKALDKDAHRRGMAVAKLCALPSRKSAQILQEVIEKYPDDKSTRRAAISGLVRMGDKGDLAMARLALDHRNDFCAEIVDILEEHEVSDGALTKNQRRLLESILTHPLSAAGRDRALKYFSSRKNPPIGKFYREATCSKPLCPKAVKEDMVRGLFMTYQNQYDRYKTFAQSTMTPHEKRQVINNMLTCRYMLEKISRSHTPIRDCARRYLEKLPPMDRSVRQYASMLGDVGIFKLASETIKATPA